MSAFVNLGKYDNSAQALRRRPLAKLSRQARTSFLRRCTPRWKTIHRQSRWFADSISFAGERRLSSERKRQIESEL